MCILYFGIGFEDKVTEFCKIYLILMLMIQAATAMGYALSSVFNEVGAAVAFAPIVNMPLNLLGGYAIALDGIWSQSPQKFIAWLSYISPVRYGYSGIMSCQFPQYHEDGSVYEETADIMAQYGFEDVHYWGNVFALIGIIASFRALTVLSLWMQDASKTKGMTDNRNVNIPKRRSQQQDKFNPTA